MQLACSNGSDLSGVEAALERLAIAAERRLMKELVQRDLDLHIALTRAPGNSVLAEIGAKFLFPLFAFIQIRVLTSEQGPDAWIGDLPNHRLVLHMIR
jgi:DNA-binding GntR family transcriptional regulator